MTPRSKPQSCIGCPLASCGSDFSQPEGSGSLGVMVCAEASGEMEARDELPLRPYAPAGSVYERTLRRLGLSRQQLVTTNLLRCRPPSNFLDGAPYESASVRHCQPNLLSVYSKFKPRVILALGNIPFSHLAGEGGPGRTVSTMRGYVFRPSASYSSVLADDAEIRDVVILPTYHPSHIRRGASELIGVFARDIMRARNIASGKDSTYLFDPVMAWNREEIGYVLEPSLDEAWAYYRMLQAMPSCPISVDIETYESMSLDEDAREQFQDTNIRMIQFSQEENRAIVFPWNKEFREVASLILHLPNPKFFHNGRQFDLRVLAAVGERLESPQSFIPEGRVYDTLDMWRRWQFDLPGNLQYVSSFVNFPFPWKHMNETNPKFYAATDADAGRRVGMMLMRSMRDAGEVVVRGFERHVSDVYDIPHTVAKNGVTLNVDVLRKLLNVIVGEQRTLMTRIETVYPESIRSVSPAEGYKKQPKQVDEFAKRWQMEKMGLLLSEDSAEVTLLDGEDETAYISRRAGLVRREFKVKEKNKVTMLTETVNAVRWCRLGSLSANSRPQIIAYAKLKGHEVPTKSRKDGARAESLTLDDIEYMYAKTHDQYYLLISKYRHLDDEKSCVLDLIQGANSSEKVIHPFFLLDCEGRTKSKAISFPQLGSRAIGAVRAAAGRKLVLALVDSPADIILASLSKDSGLAQLLSSGRNWISRIEGISPEAMRGFMSGMTDMGILEANRLTLGTSLKSVRKMRDEFNRRFNALARWQVGLMNRVHGMPNPMLVNRWGEMRRFYEVYVPNRRGGWDNGPQASAAIRFLPESEAVGAMIERVRWIRDAGWTKALSIMSRDFLVFDVERGEAEQCADEIRRVFLRPLQELGGISLPALIYVGDSMSAMYKVD